MLTTLVQIVGYDPVAAAPVTLCAASHDDSRLCHLNAQTWWPTIAKLPTLRYDFFDGAFGGQITAPSSSLTLSAEPWALFGRYQLADAAIRLWTGELGADWSSYTLRFDGRISAQPETADQRAEIDFAVDDRWLDTALLNTYAGTTGIEGPATLKGQPKPLALGAPRYVAGTLIDAINSVFQVSGYGVIHAFEAAMEKLARYGAPIGDAADFASLVAADIPAGRWATCRAQGLARFGAPPTGQVSFLVQGDAAGPNGWARKPGQLIRRIAQLSGGLARLDDASLNALDAATSATLSIYLDQQTTARELIQKIAASVNAVALVSWTGKLFVLPIDVRGGGITLAADGSSLPPVSSVKQIAIDAPWQKLAIGAERAWTVHALSDIAFEAALVDLGDYVSGTTYREGNIVSLSDGSRWLYVSTTPSAGNAPFDGSAFWTLLSGRTQATYDDGTPIEDLKPAQAGADVTGDNTSKDTQNVGGRPSAEVIDDLDRVKDDLDITRGEVDIVRADVDIITPSLFDLAKIANTINTYMQARTTLEGKPIGTVIVDVRTVTESAVEELHLIGAKNGDNTAFLLNMNTVWTSAGVSLAQRFDQVEAKASDAIQALSTSVSEAMASAAESVASQINTVQVKFGADIDAATQSTLQAVTDGDHALSLRIDEGETNYGQFKSDYQTYQQAVADQFHATSERIDTVAASFGQAIDAATQSTMTALTDGDHALASRIDAGEANFDHFSADFEDYRQGVANDLGANSEAIDTVKASIDGADGIAAQVGFLRSAVVTPGGNAQAKAVLSLKANGHVGGLIATNDGEILALDLDFDVFRFFKPDGTLLLTAGPDDEVSMPNVRINKLVAGTIDFEFTGDRQLLDPAGWVQELPGGFIMMGGQYRASLASEVTISIVYPKPFPLQTLAYGANGYNSNGNNRKDLYPQNTGAPSPAGATFFMQAPNDNAIALDGFDWWAWGR